MLEHLTISFSTVRYEYFDDCAYVCKLIRILTFFLTIEYVPPFRGDNDLPGEDTDGETPVPIPNTEAKLVRPMVVFTGESRYRQDYEAGSVYAVPASPFFIRHGWVKDLNCN
jgi:hypothetical protein